jgi:hypothetical protein
VLLIHKTDQTRGRGGDPTLRFSGSAGANCGTLSVTVADLPEGWQFDEPLPGAIRFRAAGKELHATYVPAASTSRIALVLHDSSAGTWHGAGVATSDDTLAARLRVQPWAGVWSGASQSGGADYVALLLTLDTTPLDIVTSGYRGRRDWCVATIDPRTLAVTTQTRAKWLAMHTPEVTL